MRPGRALDLACGEGRNAVWLATLGWTVTAVDFASAALDKGRQRAAADGVDERIEFVDADVTTWQPEPGAYDLVIAAYLHLVEPDRSDLWRRAAGALAPGGALVIVGHDRTNIAEGYGGPQAPEVLYSAEEVAATVPELLVERAERVERAVTTPDGLTAVALDCLLRLRAPA